MKKTAVDFFMNILCDSSLFSYSLTLASMEAPMRVLLVEDEEHLAESIGFNLEMEGYNVRKVGNGAEAVKVFKGEKFNLVILDVMLPEIEGYAVCRKIRLEN